MNGVCEFHIYKDICCECWRENKRCPGYRIGMTSMKCRNCEHIPSEHVFSKDDPRYHQKYNNKKENEPKKEKKQIKKCIIL